MKMVGGGTGAGWDSYHIVLSLPYRRGRTLMPPAKNLSITATIAKRHDGKKKPPSYSIMDDVCRDACSD